MSKVMIVILLMAGLASLVPEADAGYNHNGKWAILSAGRHNSELNTCALGQSECDRLGTAVLVEESGRFDIYLMAHDVNGIASTRYGVYCEVTRGAGFYFYGWTSCSDLETPSSGWPECGDGNAQIWSSEQPGFYVTLGILDVYVYGGTVAKLCFGPDPRTGFGEFCDGTQPVPLCNTFTSAFVFGCVGFNRLGYLPSEWCPVGVEGRSWGAVKALYH